MESRGQRIYSVERRSVFVLSLLFSFCIIFGMTCIVAYNSYTKATGTTIRSNEARATLLAKLILEHQRAAIGVLRSYGSRPLLIDSVKRKDFEGTLRHLTDLVKNNPEMEWPFISNPDSTIWVNFPVDKQIMNKDLTYRDWYKGVSREWKPYISSVFKMIAGEKDLAVAVCVPILGEKGKVIGILSTVQSTAFFQKIIGEVGLNLDANITLTDQEGHIIYSNRFPYRKEVIDYRSFEFIRRATMGEKGNVEIRDPSDGDRIKYVSFAPVEGIGWSIIVEKAKSKVLQSELSYLILIAVISLLLYTVVALSLFYLREKQRQIKALEKLNEELDGRVRERTVQLEAGNKELTKEIAEHKRAEEALRKEKEIAQEYLDIAGVILLVINADEKITLINRRGCNILGYREKEMIGKNWFDAFVPEREKERVKQAFTKLMSGEVGPVEYFENQVLTRSGEERIIAWHNTLLTGDNGNRIGTLSSGEDVTEHRRMEEALRKSEEKFRDLYDRAPVGYHEYDTDGRIISVNRTELEMLGYTAEEMIGQFIWKFSVEEEARQKILGKLAGTLPPAKNLERAYRRKDGTTVPVMIENQLVLDEKGRIKGIRSTVQDITERKRVEEDRKDLEARLQRMEKMEALGTLAGGVAHDLNNILSGLVGYPDLILMQLPESSPLREPVLGIKRSGQKSAAVVQDLLTLTRRGMVSMEVINLNGVISDYMRTPEQEKLQSSHPHVKFEVSLEPDLLSIKGSCVHFSTALMNLLSNGAGAIPERGVVTISTRNQHLERPIKGYDDVKGGDYVVLEVSDTGEGISAKDMRRIFEPFYTKKIMRRSGTGLGLSVVWGTVKDHNGYIDVRSEEGRGTTFTLYIPVTREALTRDQPPISPSNYMGKGETILVVDDEKEQRELAIAMLSELDYQVTSVSSGKEAIEYLRTRKVDLLILDMIMDPGIDGLETYRRILEFHPEQKAIIVSGFSETERIKEALTLGAGAYIKKPFLLEKIGLAVRQGLD